MKAKIANNLEATAKDMHKIKGHARIAWNLSLTSVWPNYSSRYHDYPLRNIFKNQDRDKLVICLGVEDVETRKDRQTIIHHYMCKQSKRFRSKAS